MFLLASSIISRGPPTVIDLTNEEENSAPVATDKRKRRRTSVIELEG